MVKINYCHAHPNKLCCSEAEMFPLSWLFSSLLLIIVIAVVGKFILLIVENVRLANAVKNLPTYHKRHWLFGHLPYLVRQNKYHVYNYDGAST